MCWETAAQRWKEGEPGSAADKVGFSRDVGGAALKPGVPSCHIWSGKLRDICSYLLNWRLVGVPSLLGAGMKRSCLQPDITAFLCPGQPRAPSRAPRWNINRMRGRSEPRTRRGEGGIHGCVRVPVAARGHHWQRSVRVQSGDFNRLWAISL